MLIYFHKNKLRYEKGQMAPFFILILVILIMMALVTANLSKVSLIRTGSSNAVDAGALAGGSAMANTFNAVAHATDQMSVAYWEFYAGISASIAIANGELALAISNSAASLAAANTALAQACTNPCGALGSTVTALTTGGAAITALGSFIATVSGIIAGIIAYSIAQYFFFADIRDNTQDGRDGAIELAHKLGFSNSGLGGMLKGDDPIPAEPVGSVNNYRRTFSAFLRDVGANPSYTYGWADGQERAHSVTTTVGIDTVNDYEVRVADMPIAVVIGHLSGAIGMAAGVMANLGSVMGAYSMALGELIPACIFYAMCGGCGPWCPPCCVACSQWPYYCAMAAATFPAAIAMHGTANAVMPPIYAPLDLALVGILIEPGWVLSGWGLDSQMFIFGWIEEVLGPGGRPHNRLVRVDINQQHEGADLGLWQMRYHPTHSFAIANFIGNGQIWEPERRHDATLIATDRFN